MCSLEFHNLNIFQHVNSKLEEKQSIYRDTRRLYRIRTDCHIRQYRIFILYFSNQNKKLETSSLKSRQLQHAFLIREMVVEQVFQFPLSQIYSDFEVDLQG